MTKNNDPKVLADFINCLGILENDTFLLYTALSNKIELPLVKSLLRAIAEDSLKHSTLLKGVAESITEAKETPKDCEKKTGEAWRLIANFTKEIAAKEKFSEEEMSQLWDKLAFFESIIGEEYYVFVPDEDVGSHDEGNKPNLQHRLRKPKKHFYTNHKRRRTPQGNAWNNQRNPRTTLRTKQYSSCEISKSRFVDFLSSPNKLKP